jgi:hypothetical protein
MRSSWSVSILMLFLAGCVSIKPSHVTRDTLQVPRHASRVTRYTPPASTQLFKATLDIKKHHLTGLLMIKRMDTVTPPPAPPQTGRGESSGTYRIVFMNEVGMTFFDLEMKPESFKVVSCFESLNKKMLMNIFETDFRMLLWVDPLKNGKGYIQEGTNKIVLSGVAGSYHAWQTFSPKGDTLYSTSAKSTIADPAILTFEQYKDGFPIKVTIENPFIGMKLSLRKLSQ